jgi:hypothetical protein
MTLENEAGAGVAPMPAWQDGPPAAWARVPLLSLTGLARALYALFPLHILAAAGGIFALADQYDLLKRQRVDPLSVSAAEAASVDDNVLGSLLVQLLLVAITGIVFIRWLYRARQNADALGGHFQRHSLGWASGSWFCPVVSLWFPYQIVTDVLNEAQAAARQAGPGHPGFVPGRRGYALVRLWWVLLIAGWVLIDLWWSISRQAAAEPFSGASIDDRLSAARFGMVCPPVTAVAAVLAILVVRRVTAAYRRLG